GFSGRRRQLTNFAGTAFKNIRFAHQALLMPVDKNGCQWAMVAWAGCLPICRTFKVNMIQLLLYINNKEKGRVTFLFMVANEDIANPSPDQFLKEVQKKLSSF
mgnify:CR=1